MIKREGKAQLKDADKALSVHVRVNPFGGHIVFRADARRKWYDRIEFDGKGRIHALAIRGSEWAETELVRAQGGAKPAFSHCRSCRSEGETGYNKKWFIEVGNRRGPGTVHLKTFSNLSGEGIFEQRGTKTITIYNGNGIQKAVTSRGATRIIKQTQTIEAQTGGKLSYTTKYQAGEDSDGGSTSTATISTKIGASGQKLTKTEVNQVDDNGKTTNTSTTITAEWSKGHSNNTYTSTDAEGNVTESVSSVNGPDSVSEHTVKGPDGRGFTSSTTVQVTFDSDGGTIKTTNTMLSGTDGSVKQITTEMPDGTVQTERTISNPDGSATHSTTIVSPDGTITSKGNSTDPSGSNVTQSVESVQDNQGNTTTTVVTPDGQGGTTTTTTTTDASGNGTSTETKTDSNGNSTTTTTPVGGTGDNNTGKGTGDSAQNEGTGNDASGGDDSGGGRPDPSGGGGMPSDDGEAEAPGRPTWGAFSAIVTNTDWNDEGGVLPPNPHISQSLYESFMKPVDAGIKQGGSESSQFLQYTLPDGDSKLFGASVEYVEDTSALIGYCNLLRTNTLLRGQGLAAMRAVAFLKSVTEFTE